MSFRFVFWLLMILWLLFGLGLSAGFVPHLYAWGSNLLLFVLFGLLGWKVFGPPLQP